MTPSDLLRDLVALPGPPGQEDAVRAYVRARAEGLGLVPVEDAKGNLLVSLGAPMPERPPTVVTAHLDEIALMVTGVEEDGALSVAPLGGAHPWKWGEGPVEALAAGGAFVPGVLGFGSIHTTSPASAVQQARGGAAVTWEMARVTTGLDAGSLSQAGVRPGTRVVIARARRQLFPLGGDLVAGYFLDDRADLVAWLLALEALAKAGGWEQDVVFAATASEEVGGEGAAFLMHGLHPDVCVALEIGPTSPDAPFPIDADPTVWVSDPYASMDPRDGDLLDAAARDIGLSPHWQALTRGGSDASLAASRGLCARPVTLAFAADNSHGFEIMHRGAPENLARLLVAYLSRLRDNGGLGPR